MKHRYFNLRCVFVFDANTLGLDTSTINISLVSKPLNQVMNIQYPYKILKCAIEVCS